MDLSEEKYWKPSKTDGSSSLKQKHAISQVVRKLMLHLIIIFPKATAIYHG